MVGMCERCLASDPEWVPPVGTKIFGIWTALCDTCMQEELTTRFGAERVAAGRRWSAAVRKFLQSLPNDLDAEARRGRLAGFVHEYVQTTLRDHTRETQPAGVQDILGEFRRLGISSADDFEQARAQLGPELAGAPRTFTAEETVAVLRAIPSGAGPLAVREAFEGAIRRRLYR